MGSWFPERSANFYSVLSRENSIVVITLFCFFCFEAVARGLDDISKNRLKSEDVPLFSLALKQSAIFLQFQLPISCYPRYSKTLV